MIRCCPTPGAGTTLSPNGGEEIVRRERMMGGHCAARERAAREGASWDPPWTPSSVCCRGSDGEAGLQQTPPRPCEVSRLPTSASAHSLWGWRARPCPGRIRRLTTARPGRHPRPTLHSAAGPRAPGAHPGHPTGPSPKVPSLSQTQSRRNRLLSSSPEEHSGSPARAGPSPSASDSGRGWAPGCVSCGRPAGPARQSWDTRAQGAGGRGCVHTCHQRDCTGIELTGPGP